MARLISLPIPEVPELSRNGISGFPKSFPIPALPLGRRENGNGSRDGGLFVDRWLWRASAFCSCLLAFSDPGLVERCAQPVVVVFPRLGALWLIYRFGVLVVVGHGPGSPCCVALQSMRRCPVVRLSLFAVEGASASILTSRPGCLASKQALGASFRIHSNTTLSRVVGTNSAPNEREPHASTQPLKQGLI